VTVTSQVTVTWGSLLAGGTSNTGRFLTRDLMQIILPQVQNLREVFIPAR